MTPQVRLATFADAEPCEQLEAQLRQHNAAGRGAEAFFDEYPVSFLVDDVNGFTLVALVDSVVLGFATLHVARLGSTEAARIVRIYVTPLARRVGVGDALISAAKEHARQRGCGRIDALSLPGDRDTKNLYERNGLTARLIVASSPL